MSDHNKMLIDRIKGMPAQPGDLSEEIGWLLQEIDEQNTELDRLRAEVARLRADQTGEAVCDSYADENQRFSDVIDRLRAEVSEWKMKYESEVTLVDNVEAELDRLREALMEIKKLNEMSGFNGCAIAEVYSKYLPAPPKETEG